MRVTVSEIVWLKGLLCEQTLLFAEQTWAEGDI